MSAPRSQTQAVLDKLKKVRRSGLGWAAMCPSHEDSNPSLSVAEGDKGVIFNCHRGCSPEMISGAMGIKLSDLFWEAPQKKKAGVEATYDYVDAEGTLVFQVVRSRLPDGRKDFRQRKPDGAGGWIWSTTGLDKPLYHLPRVLEAKKNGDTVWLLEGEKDVESLEALGFVATCNPGGAGKWSDEYSKTLTAMDVVICVDRDGPGYKHGLNVAESLENRAKSIRVVGPPEPHNDATDAIQAGVKPSEFPTVNLEKAIGEHDPFREIVSEIRAVANVDHLQFPQKVAKVRSILDRTEVDEAVDSFGRLVKWSSFLAEPTEDYDWIIPNILERGERLIVVAAEGVGKTMLARQVAILTSFGIHPFRKTPIQPRTTLFLDLENPEKIIRRTSKKIWDAAKIVQPYHGKDNAHLLVKPDGIDLMKAADRVEIERLVATIGPDLLFIGPVYKAYVDPGGKQTATVVGEVVRFLDYIRDTYGCALWLEHHAPLGGENSRVMRPVDSGVWSRWPEFGLSLVPDLTAPQIYDLKHFRGGRDRREFPRQLMKGGDFPFQAIY